MEQNSQFTAQDFKIMMNKLFDAFEKLAQADTTSIGANYSMSEMFMSKAIRGDRKSMETLASLFTQQTNIPYQVVQIALEEWINDYKSRQNESRKHTIRLKESELRQMISESVSKILNEAEDGGWVVDSSEAEEAYDMAAQEWGNEELNAAIVRCLGNKALAECLAYIFRVYDFRQWKNREQ